MMKFIYTASLFLLSGMVYSQDSASVLFIGNSYTYVNDLPLILNDLTNSLGDEVTYDSQTAGGATFATHAGNSATYTKINSAPWDFVVLQAQSQEPSFPDSQVNTSTLPFAMQMADSVYANKFCSDVMMFMTWGRENGDPQWAPISTFEGMNARLRSAYMRMADSVQGSVGAVGSAWAYVRETYPTIDLYAADGSHPSYEGSYLAACTFYASIFRKSPVGASFIGSLDVVTAGNLQTAAALTVLDSLDQWNLRPLSEYTQADFSLLSSDPTVDFTNLSTKATTYSWDFGDSNGSTDENPSHTYSADGTFTVTLTAESPCDTDSIAYQVTITSAGISELHNTFAIKYIGNGVFSFNGEELIEEVEVFNMEGRKVPFERYDGNTVKVDLSGNEYGIYLINLKSKTGVVNGRLPYLMD
jgi:hypothetical protein